MPATDFLTNVETAFLTVFEANALLNVYNWQRWDSDAEADLPRAVLLLAARRDPQETPYHAVEVNIHFEGRPKKGSLTQVVNELTDVLETVTQADLDAASGNTVKFMGMALSVTQSRSIQGGLRVWAFSFIIYALPMVTTPPSQPPLLTVQDDFNRADGGLGSNWGYPTAANQTFLLVRSNEVGPQDEGNHAFAFWNANVFNDDQWSQIRIKTIGPWTGAILRADNVLDRFYLGLVFGVNDYRLLLRWDGTFTQLAIGTAVTWAVGDLMKITIQGSTHPAVFKMFRNSTEVLSFTTIDAAQVRTGGSPGIGIFSPVGAGLTLDDWEGGDL